ncbi:hypothetical protein DCAR_0418103 [Daucus carota subsp. sativus]|uniref:MADS-box domain-containing protein n=1 Tax=Daucus carota subsp. sativus TaxID=79200 RepID=A0A165Z5L4_DAUCS|nr:PREDICTED: agamous-like MADS-box protein AGL103 [Daucus carota subsp. sativus]WOG98758.1 hypothetical protein DCAR_0418103 [Daucus carota subsp. sativus]
MGRAKLNMELIEKAKVRTTTFLTRKKNLTKKAKELATLCGIKTAVIINPPRQVTPQGRPLKLETYPENDDVVLELIDKYKGQSSEDRKKRTSLLPCFFQERNRKVQRALAKLRSTNVRSKYPTWDLRFDNFMEEDLRNVAVFLENKIVDAKGKLGQMKANVSNSNNIYNAYLLQQQQMMLTRERSMEVGNQNGINYLFTINPPQTGFMQVPVPMPMPIQQQNFAFLDHYQDQRMVTFGHDYIGGAPNIEYNANSSTPLYNYPMMTGDSITYANNSLRDPQNYSDEGRQPFAHHQMENHHMRLGSTPHQMVATSHQVDAHAQFDENHIE